MFYSLGQIQKVKGEGILLTSSEFINTLHERNESYCKT